MRREHNRAPRPTGSDSPVLPTTPAALLNSLALYSRYASRRRATAETTEQKLGDAPKNTHPHAPQNAPPAAVDRVKVSIR